MLDLVLDLHAVYWLCTLAGEDLAISHGVYRRHHDGSDDESPVTIKDACAHPQLHMLAAQPHAAAEASQSRTVAPAEGTGKCVCTIPVLKNRSSSYVRAIADHCFQQPPALWKSSKCIDEILFVPQEICVAHAYGCTSGLVVHVDLFDVRVVGLFEALLLGETVRRVALALQSEVAKWRDHSSSRSGLEQSREALRVCEWDEYVALVAQLVAEAIADAPVDARRALWAQLMLSVSPAIGAPLDANRLRGDLSAAIEAAVPFSPQRCTKTKVRVVTPIASTTHTLVGASIVAEIGYNQPQYHLTRDAWGGTDQHGSEGASEHHGHAWDALLVPADHVSYEAHRMHAARDLVRGAPSLVASLPDDLLDRVAAALSRRLCWPTVPALRAASYLPPEECIGEAALAASRRAAKARASQTRAAGSSQDAGDAAPGPVSRRQLALLSEDGQCLRGHDKLAGRETRKRLQQQELGRTVLLQPCLDELATKLRTGRRWLRGAPPTTTATIMRASYANAVKMRTGDTGFTL